MEKTGLPMQGGSRATARWLRSAMWGRSLQPIDGDFGDGLLLGLPLTDFSLCSLMLLMIGELLFVIYCFHLFPEDL